jgi:UDP:flavonoid glycosyltransferase YjiC (YdhE family)
MIAENINKCPSPRNILIAPLDWGLGHATRCIPIIQGLASRGHHVFLAASGSSKALLKERFPELPMFELSPTNISYSTGSRNLLFSLLTQVPGLLLHTRKENKWLAELVKIHHIDLVISDNRPGLFHKHIETIYITHQLRIFSGKRWLDGLLTASHRKLINKFSRCWVPDVSQVPGLAGELSHPGQLPSIPVDYIGPQSRFETVENVIFSDYTLLLLSGPEPQRSLLETRFLEEAKRTGKKYILVRGLPGTSRPIEHGSNVTVYAHLPTEELSRIIVSARQVFCRAGYSTIMDLVRLNKHAVLIPTPGQGEQEYLAEFLSGENYFSMMTQEEVRLDGIEEKSYRAFPVVASSLTDAFTASGL